MESTWGPEFVTDPTAEAEMPIPDETEDEDTGVIPPPEPDRASMTRALRELEAAKQRVERDAQRERDRMREDLVAQLFPVLDNIDRTIAAAQRNHESPAVVEGVFLVRRQLVQTLERYDVHRIDARGQRFDPGRHEAISVVVVDDPRHDRLVVDQLEPGYVMGDRLLRPAKVVVGRARQRASV